MRSLPAALEPGPPRIVALLDVLFVLLLFLLLVGDLGRRQPPVRLPRSRFPSGCLHGSPRRVLTIHHGPQDECGPYRRHQRCLDRDHWHMSADGLPNTDPSALARELNDGRRRVILRADADAPYGVVQAGLCACAEAGIEGVAVSAWRQPEP